MCAKSANLGDIEADPWPTGRAHAAPECLVPMRPRALARFSSASRSLFVRHVDLLPRKVVSVVVSVGFADYCALLLIAAHNRAEPIPARAI